ncbi:hypothetical protein B0H13DRAFT_2506415 [Mycena leptocephala]|nr:hypothetical protein B0H13DRAFT_2506415 [Mycena leptocephala]
MNPPSALFPRLPGYAKLGKSAQRFCQLMTKLESREGFPATRICGLVECRNSDAHGRGAYAFTSSVFGSFPIQRLRVYHLGARFPVPLRRLRRAGRIPLQDATLRRRTTKEGEADDSDCEVALRFIDHASKHGRRDICHFRIAEDRWTNALSYVTVSHHSPVSDSQAYMYSTVGVLVEESERAFHPPARHREDRMQIKMTIGCGPFVSRVHFISRPPLSPSSESSPCSPDCSLVRV